MKTNIQGLMYDKVENSYRIQELEVSITSKCHLRCDNCGFYIPHQPHPALTKNIVSEIVDSLKNLQRLNIKIGSLGVLGGEPTFNQKILLTCLQEFSMFDNIERIEVVTHGLMPQNISKEALQLLNKLTISVYFDSEKLARLWADYISRYAPHVELSLRINKEWDKWLGEEIVDAKKAQEMFALCWYRKHCVTVERQRLFLCSRIAKLSQDKEGIVLNDKTTIEQIESYLNQDEFLPSCKTCTPMMGLPTVKAGQQPDRRILNLLPRAINFLETELNEKL